MKNQLNTTEQELDNTNASQDTAAETVLVYNRPPLQKVSAEILKSNERPSLAAVISEELPPRGLSGMLRRYAFGFSESEYGHWLPLILADRIQEVEGIIQDLGRGKIPNILQERGCCADWKYNRKSVVRKLIITGIGIGAVACMFVWKKKQRNSG